MEELVNLVAEKTGLTHDQAQVATQVVLDFLKSRLPAPVSGQLDGVLQGGGGGLGDLASGLGGLFGKR